MFFLFHYLRRIFIITKAHSVWYERLITCTNMQLDHYSFLFTVITGILSKCLILMFGNISIQKSWFLKKQNRGKTLNSWRTLTRWGASWRVSWKCGFWVRQAIHECLSTCSAAYRWWGSTCSIWDSRSCKQHQRSISAPSGLLWINHNHQ